MWRQLILGAVWMMVLGGTPNADATSTVASDVVMVSDVSGEKLVPGLWYHKRGGDQDLTLSEWSRLPVEQQPLWELIATEKDAKRVEKPHHDTQLPFKFAFANSQGQLQGDALPDKEELPPSTGCYHDHDTHVHRTFRSDFSGTPLEIGKWYHKQGAQYDINSIEYGVLTSDKDQYIAIDTVDKVREIMKSEIHSQLHLKSDTTYGWGWGTTPRFSIVADPNVEPQVEVTHASDVSDHELKFGHWYHKRGTTQDITDIEFSHLPPSERQEFSAINSRSDYEEYVLHDEGEAKREVQERAKLFVATEPTVSTQPQSNQPQSNQPPWVMNQMPTAPPQGSFKLVRLDDKGEPLDSRTISSDLKEQVSFSSQAEPTDTAPAYVAPPPTARSFIQGNPVQALTMPALQGPLQGPVAQPKYDNPMDPLGLFDPSKSIMDAMTIKNPLDMFTDDAPAKPHEAGPVAAVADSLAQPLPHTAPADQPRRDVAPEMQQDLPAPAVQPSSAWSDIEKILPKLVPDELKTMDPMAWLHEDKTPTTADMFLTYHSDKSGELLRPGDWYHRLDANEDINSKEWAKLRRSDKAKYVRIDTIEDIKHIEEEPWVKEQNDQIAAQNSGILSLLGSALKKAVTVKATSLAGTIEDWAHTQEQMYKDLKLKIIKNTPAVMQHPGNTFDGVHIPSPLDDLAVVGVGTNGLDIKVAHGTEHTEMAPVAQSTAGLPVIVPKQ